jgi:hypothetical protein
VPRYASAAFIDAVSSVVPSHSAPKSFTLIVSESLLGSVLCTEAPVAYPKDNPLLFVHVKLSVPAEDVQSPPYAGARPAINVPDVILLALVVSVVADGAKFTPLVFVHVSIDVPTDVVQSPEKAGSRPEDKVPLDMLLALVVSTVAELANDTPLVFVHVIFGTEIPQSPPRVNPPKTAELLY